MNRLILSIIFAVFLINVTSSSVILGENNGFVQMKCYPKLINMYGIEQVGDDDEILSTLPSEIQKASCKNLTNSCCNDGDFNHMTEISGQRIRGIEESIIFFKSVYNKLGNAKKEDLAIIQSSNNVSQTEFDELMSKIKSVKPILFSSLDTAFSILLNYSSGLNCSICHADNHSQFLNLESSNPKIKVDINFCRSLLSFDGFMNIFYINNAFLPIEKFTSLIANNYNQNYNFEDNEKEQDYGLINEQRKKCLTDDDLVNNNKCLEICFELAPFNRNLFSTFSKNILYFSVLVNDFLTTKEILQNQNTELFDKTYEKLNNKLKITDILVPNDEDNNLNVFKFHPVENEGWNLNTQGMKSWSRYVESQKVFMIASIALLISLISK